jgi:hypothetical protein
MIFPQEIDYYVHIFESFLFLFHYNYVYGNNYFKTPMANVFLWHMQEKTMKYDKDLASSENEFSWYK